MSSKFQCLKAAIVDGAPEEPAIIFVVNERMKTKQWRDGVTIKEVVRTLNRYKDPIQDEISIASVKAVMEAMAKNEVLTRIPGQFMRPGCRGVQARYLLPSMEEIQ